MIKTLKSIIRKCNNILQKAMYILDYRINNPINRLFNDFQHLYNKNGYNLCFDIFTTKDYDPDKRNILIALESPAVILHQKWLNPNWVFIAEISFGNFYNLKNYYCPRELYSTNDFYVNLDVSKKYNKNKLTSMIYSSQRVLEGHKLRYEVANRFKEQIEIFGPETKLPEKKLDTYYYTNSKYIRKRISLDDYMFQIVIENGKYPNYVSEKFFDCIKTHTIPIYWGGEQSVKLMGFNPEGVIFLDSVDDLEEILNKEVSVSTYKKKIEAIKYNFNKLIEIRNRQKFNFFLNTILASYLHTTESYHGGDYSRLALNLD